LREVFSSKPALNLQDFIHLNKNVSSELYCIVMALLYKDIPCTKTIHRLKKKFNESTSRGSGSRSPGLASPRIMGGVKEFVNKGGHSPRGGGK
jgi:hypothetical protein